MGGTLSTEPAKDSTKKKKSKKKGDDKDLIVPSERQTADEPQPEAAEWPEAATTVEAEPEGFEEWPEGMPARGEPWPVERPASRKPSVPDAASPATWRTPATPLRGRSEVEPETDSFGVFGMLPKSSRTYSRQLAERTQGTTQSTSALPASCLLRIRVLKAQLRKKRAGLVGDLAEVAVVARLGRQAARTALAELGAQGAEWHETLELRVPETPGAGRLDLEVMSMTVHREELLGKTSLQLFSSGLGPAWTQRRMPLGAGECQLDLEMQLLPPGVQPQGEREQEDLDYQLGARMFQPKGQALPWLGVRVLELTRRTWTAPFAGRLMASCGAEVVRCAFGEEALLVRKKQGVKVGAASKEPHSVPKELHHGKRLAKELPEDPRDLATLKAELLPGCNVFLTDLPADELDEMQLGAAELRQQYPWLIFVHASTVGMLADVSNKGISDAGAFFSLSGLAEQLGHVLGPAGFAAAVAGSALFGVASMAVMRRRCGSPGDRVEMSIFRAGRWCSGLGALTGWTRPPAPDLRLAAEGVAVPPMATPFDVEGVGFVPPKRPAGANPRWSVLEPSLLLPAVRPECPVAAELPLARVSVIELSDEYQVSATALGAMLADLGAQVTKVERPQRPDPWKRTCPQLYQDLTCRKEVQQVNYTGVGGSDAKSGAPLPGQAALYRTLAEATVLVTNLPLAALEAWGLEPKRLREMFPHLIIVLITTWGCDVWARERELSRKGGQESHAFWEASGLGQTFGVRSEPPGLGELSLAQLALGGLGAALLRQQRTGNGQLVQVSRHRAGVYCQRLSALEPPEPLSSPLLQTLDGRFLRLLGRGHQPHDAWVLLHAVGRRENLADQLGGGIEKLRQKLEGYSWEEIQKHQDELLACAREWTFEDLSKAFQDKGITWFVEEMRPTDAEALHRQRAEQLEALRQKQQDAAEKALEMGQRSSEFQQQLQEAKASAQAELHDRLVDQNEQQKKMELLREQFNTGVPPVIGVTIDAGEGLVSPLRGNRICPYCVIEIEHKPYSRLETAALEGTSPAWDYTGILPSFVFGDIVKFAVYHKEPDLAPADPAASPTSLEHTTVLYLQVVAGYNLLNRDTGLLGDVSDPYVTAQVGEMTQKTPVINNDLNPIWQERNQFSFNIAHHEADRYLFLEVMNSNNFRDDSLGSVKLDTRSLEPNQWHHYRLKLEEGQGGELEFDAYLKPAQPCKPLSRKDELIGQAEVSMEKFYPHGFEGALPLQLNDKPTEGLVHVFIEVEPKGVKLKSGHRRASSQMSIASVGSLPSRTPSASAVARARSQASAGQASVSERPAPGSLGEAEKSVLQIRINEAMNLTNRDSGLFGDVSDPYVVVRAAGVEQKTPTINNNLNPVWEGDNLFSFNIGAEDHKVEFEVMDANTFKDSSLGSCELDLRAVQVGIWTRFNEKLVDGVNGELVLDVFFNPTEFRQLATAQSNTLHMRVNNARDLPNTDSGVLGDVSDPYVLVKVGEVTRRTPTINNNLNPDWLEGNLFTFSVEEGDAVLEVEVMNANVVRDDSLGKASVHLGQLEENQWVRLVEELHGSDSGSARVELDVFFKPNAHYRLNHEVQQAKKEEKNCLAEAARLSKEVQMAERARTWLANVDENTKMPLSLEEQDWVTACGGRNFVAPAWVTVTHAQVDVLVQARQRHPHPVALFPEAAGRSKGLRLKVKLIGAFGLRSAFLHQRSQTYCTCEIPLKKDSKVSSDRAGGAPNPEWGSSRTIRSYAPGDALVLEVYGATEDAEHSPRVDELLGRAFLPGKKFYPDGFDGLLNLTLGPRQTGATLRVTALVTDA